MHPHTTNRSIANAASLLGAASIDDSTPAERRRRVLTCREYGCELPCPSDQERGYADAARQHAERRGPRARAALVARRSRGLERCRARRAPLESERATRYSE